eukprot:1702969-Pyramimonas_sp.AAC.2
MARNLALVIASTISIAPSSLSFPSAIPPTATTTFQTAPGASSRSLPTLGKISEPNRPQIVSQVWALERVRPIQRQ